MKFFVSCSGSNCKEDKVPMFLNMDYVRHVERWSEVDGTADVVMTCDGKRYNCVNANPEMPEIEDCFFNSLVLIETATEDEADDSEYGEFYGL